MPFFLKIKQNTRVESRKHILLFPSYDRKTVRLRNRLFTNPISWLFCHFLQSKKKLQTGIIVWKLDLETCSCRPIRYFGTSFWDENLSLPQPRT